MKAVGVIVIASRAPAWVVKIESDYAVRMAGFRLEVRTVKPSSPEKETAAVLAAVPKRGRIFLLDANGILRESEAFAAWLGGLLEDAPPVFVIGSASGLPAPLRTHAAGVVSLSPLTLAHNVARLVLAEQLFRADCIMRGHPYPK